MFKEFREFVLPLVEQGIKKFVIYPYGENGVAVHDLLVKCCNIQPIAIVDNNLSKMNSSIISFEQFSKMNIRDCFVILTVEDANLNRDMYAKLASCVGTEFVINICKNRLGRAVDNIDNFSIRIENIIGDETNWEKGDNSNRKKIRILVGGHCVWNTVLRLVKEIQNDKQYDLLAISSGWDSPLDNAWLSEHGIPFVKARDYIPKEDKPDVLFLINTGDNVSPINTMALYAQKVIVLPVVIFMGGIPKNALKKSVLGFENIEPDYYLLDKYMYNLFRDEPIKGEIVEIGNPKFDDIFYYQNTVHDYPDEWKKIKGKKVFLWAPDHGICPGNKIIDAISFDKYVSVIFDFFSKHENTALIFRPHRVLMDELLDMGYWSVADLDRFEVYCRESPNIVYDKFDSYNEAYYFCDAIMVDPHCGIVLSSLPLNKPICLLYRNNQVAESVYEDTYQGLEKNYYTACNVDELYSFIDMVRNGHDTLKECRILAGKKYITNYDGLNSKRIKNFIETVIGV